MSLILVNYRHRESEFGKSITSLPLEEAMMIADELYKNCSCKAHNRFGSFFVQYYKDRKKAEQWLYERCQQMGVHPKVRHPIYFTLQESEELSANFGEYRKSILNLDEIADEDISFTFGDSMSLYYEGSLSRILTKEELFEQIRMDNCCENGNDFFANIRSQCEFVEAQLWNEEYLSK